MHRDAGRTRRRDALHVVMQAPVAIAVLDGPDHRLSIVNAAWRELFGYDGGVDVPAAELPMVSPAVIGEITRAFTTGDTIELEQAALPGAPDQPPVRNYRATIQPLRGARRKITGVMITCRDTSGELRVRIAFEEAERANRLKDRFLAAVSHELRAPIATLLLWERILRDPSSDDEQRARALEAIHQSAVTQSRLVADLLDVSRAISGKLHVNNRVVDIDRVIRGAVDRGGPAAVARQLELVTELVPSLGSVLGDQSRLEQILDNLISNAIKFTPSGGRVIVSGRREQAHVVVDVLDTGRGIARDQLTSVFEPFSQLGEDHGEGGLGLGLTIVRELTGLQGGTITADSEGPGKGARFTLRIPQAPRSRELTPETKTARRKTLRGVKILVVDDDQHVLDALRLLLARAGASVTCETSAAAAFATLHREHPDVLLSDIAMPIEDGHSLVRRLRRSGSDVPAIALTAHAAVADRDHALAAGFDLHVAKPVDLERLVASILHLIERQREKAT
ncbi:MAG: ATP-binding protein [Myxococcota bacterium]|nr:ATP-binding protein [Myxococcota bacterium]